MSRRDDLESLGYMIVYFLKGKLPWQGIKAKDKKTKRRKVWMKKWETSADPEDLCQELGNEFSLYLKYCRNLEFEEKYWDSGNYFYAEKLILQSFIDDIRHWDIPASTQNRI